MTPQDMLIRLNREFPEAWPFVDELRADRGKDLPDWPQRVFLPMAGWYATTCQVLGTERLDLKQIGLMHALSALGTWRVTQDIVRFDPDVYAAVVDTPLSEIPTEVLFRIPAWCVYIETRDMHIAGNPCTGFFAFLEHDVDARHDEVRLMFVVGESLYPVVLHVREGSTLESALRETTDDAIARAESVGLPPKRFADEVEAYYPEQCRDQGIIQAVNLLLFLCAYGFEGQERTASGGGTYKHPSPKRTKGGWRLFPPKKTTLWLMGGEIGDEIRKAVSTASRASGTHASPRPHVRRAHWHGYWSGTIKPKDGIEPKPRRFDLKWLPPTPVALKDEEA